MSEGSMRDERLTSIDRMMREIAWHAQKQLTHALTTPAIDLTLPQLMTLSAIAESGVCRMSSLSVVTKQSAGTLTGIVDRLIKDGLVDRVRNSDDRRVVEVALTPQGEARLQAALKASWDDTARNLDAFEHGDLQQLERMLSMLLAAVQGEERALLARTVHL